MVHSQSWRSNADALVVNQIFANVVSQGDIYTFPNLLTSNDTVFLADGTFVNVPYTNCYGYFVDLQPYAHWAHSCVYCFVNASYNYVITPADMPPVCDNLTSLSLCSRPNPAPSLPFAFDPTFTREIPNNSDPQHLWAVLICGTEEKHNKEQDHLPEYWFDLSCVYTVLTDVFGYQESDMTGYNSHILVSAPPSVREKYLNDFNNFTQNTSYLNGKPSLYGDFFYKDNYPDETAHTKNNIHNIFKCFAGNQQCLQDYSELGLRQLTEEDQLFIFVTGHGSRKNNKSGFYVHQDDGQYEWINDETFVEWLRNIRCSQMTLFLEPCFSGGFVDEFLNDTSNQNCLCKNRIGQSATSATGLSYTELYKVYSPYSNTTSNDVSEFVYYWTSSALGYYPYLHVDRDNDSVDAGPWMRPSVGRGVGNNTMNWIDYFGNYNSHSDYDVNPDTDGDGILSFYEMFEFANNLDTWSEQGYYNPYNPGQGFVPEDPQQRYESSFTMEAATLIGYEGQIDGIVNSGTPTQPYRLCGDIWVGPNASLTMCDEVQSPANVKIYVKPTGRLILDGGRLRNPPETGSGMWEGVQVWGDTLTHQFEVNGSYGQGYLEMKNGAAIENARCAIQLWHPQYYNTTGGIIHATDATFRNNVESVMALYYTNHTPNTNKPTIYNSFFKNCNFVIDTAYIGTTAFNKHVSLSHIDGIPFLGCTFSANRSLTGVSSNCCGVIADQAKVSIGSYCTDANTFPCPNNSLVHSSFTGFHTGIYAFYDGSGVENFSVNSADFYNNECGIYALNAHYITILSSSFTVGSGNEECAFGIYADHVSGFCIEENTFCPKPNINCTTYGIGMVNSCSSNEIHLNQFGGLTCANVAVGQNVRMTGNTPQLTSGLTYSCNDNTGGSANQIDFCVLDDSGAAYSGIQQAQGSSALPAGNTFGGTHYHFYNDGDHCINYYYNQNQSGEIPSSTKISYVTLYGTTNANTCPSHYDNNVPVEKSQEEKAELASAYLAAHSAYNSLKQLYDSRIDGGSTPTELSDIINATPSDMWQLRAQLLGHSPYLSQEVLTTAADRDDVFTDPVLFEILSANPDELKKDTLISYLENKDNPLPGYMVDLLRQIANGATARTALESQMARYSHDFRLAAGDIVRSNLCESESNPTELRTWLAAMEDIAADRLIVASYMEEGNYTDAFALANMLPDLYGLEGDGLADHTDYMRLLGLYRALGTSGRTAFEMTEEETEMVEGIAEEGKGTSKAMAEALLSGVTGDRSFTSYFCPELPKPKRSDRGSNDSMEVLMNEAMGFSASVSPSPATTWVKVDYTLPTGVAKAVLSLTSTMGIKVMEMELNGNQGSKVLDLRSLAAGVYAYSIRCGEYVKTGKLVITK